MLRRIQMNVPVTPSYQVPLLVLSYVIAVAGSMIALTAARQIVGRDGRVNKQNAAIGGLALGGIGVWSMHFTGMLAAKLNMGVSYSGVETVVSLVAAVLASAFALSHVARNPKQLSRILVAGTLLGMGVVVMHYLGMYGMRFGGYIDWSWGLVGLSALIAVVAATAALWLAFNTQTWAIRTCAALVMGVAVCAMHYTGMAAANFICTTSTPHAIPSGFGIFSSLELPIWVTALTVVSAFVLALHLGLRHLGEPARMTRA
jgi:NO-binding membrane sensor protein with MHYT domain